MVRLSVARLSVVRLSVVGLSVGKPIMLKHCTSLLLSLGIAASATTLNTGCAPTIVAGGVTAVTIAHDRRTAATVLEDRTIEFKAHNAFHVARDRLQGSHINVHSYNNVVLLTGEVTTPELAAWADETVQNIEKVRFVHNELSIAPASTVGSRSNDAWISTKAKTSLLKIQDLEEFDVTRVKVVTERGVIYLFGLVTPQEGDAVTNTVRRLVGVQQVVKLFEYI